MQNKIAVLIKIAALLNENAVTWAVGASCLLYLKGISGTFNDIDFYVIESDVEKTLSLLKNTEGFQSYNIKYFADGDGFAYEFTIDGVELEFDYRFKDFPMKKESIAEIITVNNTKIPLQSLDDWLKYYRLMGRAEKVRLLEKSLSHTNNRQRLRGL